MIRQCPAAVIGYYEGGGGEEVSGGFGQNGRNSVLTYSLGNAVSASSNGIVISNILAIYFHAQYDTWPWAWDFSQCFL